MATRATSEMERNSDLRAAQSLLASSAAHAAADLNVLARVAYMTESANGFLGHEEVVIELSDLVNPEDQAKYEGAIVRVPNPSLDAEKLLLAAGEIGEAFEAIRDGDPEEEAREVADAIIRLIGYCHRKGYDVGRAVTEKMAYNLDRPYRHGRLR